MADKVYSHGRPLNAAFYAELRSKIRSRQLSGRRDELPQGRGMVVRAPAGSLIAFELPQGRQIVNVFFWNADDPDERYWAEETMLIEGAYLQRETRLWGTMARFRPLATVVEDTVVTLRRRGEPQSFHHFAHGGSGTPSDWRYRGGRAGVASTWERLTGAMREVNLGAHELTENVSLFQKTAIDAVSQVLTILPCDAVPGDRMVWFAEIDLMLAVAASPYREGGMPPAELDGSTRDVVVTVEPDVAQPLGWPYPGLAYPDLSLYLDPATGTRANDVAATRGIGAYA
jgi:uncharacterized protein YcgI (DUF1989 family)